MPRIAHVCRVGWPQIGGMETAVHGLARAQRLLGWDVAVYTARDVSGVDAEHEGVAYRRLPRLGPRRYPLLRGIAGAVRGADLVHVHGLDANLDWLVRARGVHGARVGVSTHGGFLHTDRNPTAKQAWLRLVTRPSLRRADAVWFTSRADEHAIAGPGVGGVVLPNGVAVAGLLGTPREPVAGRWLVPGRIDVHKGIDDLLCVLGALPPSTRPAEVRVVGPCREPELLRELQALATRLGVSDLVRWVGPVDRPAWEAELSSAEWGVFPSRHEGFGIAVVEALAAGLPVVVSDIAAHRELVQTANDGVVVPMQHAASAVEVLKGLAGRDTNMLSEAARSRARDYAWDAVLPRYLNAYERAGVSL